MLDSVRMKSEDELPQTLPFLKGFSFDHLLLWGVFHIDLEKWKPNSSAKPQFSLYLDSSEDPCFSYVNVESR